MAKDIEPKLKFISDYLTLNEKEKFVIPEYQRGYSWNIEQCDKLWQDIEDFIDRNNEDPYFFGTIIEDCSDTEANTLKLIDGQQRTTTFLLLIKALQLKLQEVSDKAVDDQDSKKLLNAINKNRDTTLKILFKADDDKVYEILEDWNEIKGRILLDNNSINELYKDELQTIISAKTFIEAEEKVIKIPRKQKDNKYTNHFRNFKFFYNKLCDYDNTRIKLFADVFLKKCQVIEIKSWQTEQAITMFNSLNSTGMSLSDADIISAQMYSNAGENKNEFNTQWESICKLVSELNSKKIIDIDSVLQEYMYICRAKSKEYMRSGSPDVTTPGLRNYYTIINKDILKNPYELCSSFSKIAHIWDKICYYPIIKLLLKFNENAKIYLISYLFKFELKDITEKTVCEIAECFIRLFTVLELVEAGYSSNNFKTFLFGVNVKLVDEFCSIQEIKDDFNRHILETWNKEELKSALLEYENNILVFLNEYLYVKSKKLSFNFSETVNIEHIMPASGHNIETIRKDSGIETKQEFDSIVNRLGNKILLEENINKSISNEWFKTKKQSSVNDKTGYKDSKYNIAKTLVSYSSDLWTVNDIEKATNKAADRIIDFIF